MGIREFFEEDELLRKNIFKFSPVAQPTAIVRKECFDKVGYYNPSYSSAEDIDFSFRLGEYFKFGNILEVLLMYREHPNSATYTRTRKQISSTLEIRASHFRSESYSTNLSDYLAFGTTWIFQFLPSKFVIATFKFVRRAILFLVLNTIRSH